MGNHVIYDALWESDRLAECSRDAAMAYPWIFLVADDHGRFEYRPRMIWKKAFAFRNDVTVEDVTRWLEEYWKVGLLIRYHIDGELAYWYKFKGRKPSDRKPPQYADPAGIPEFTYQEHGTSATSPPRPRHDVATPPPRGGLRDRSEQSRDRAEIEQSGTDVAPPAPPTTQALATIPAGRRWNQPPIEHWARLMGPVNNAQAARITNALKPVVNAHGWATVEPLWVEALEEAAGWGDPGRFTPEVFARTFTARLNKTRGLAPARASPDPVSKRRDEGDMAMIRAGRLGK